MSNRAPKLDILNTISDGTSKKQESCVFMSEASGTYPDIKQLIKSWKESTKFLLVAAVVVTAFFVAVAGNAYAALPSPEFVMSTKDNPLQAFHIQNVNSAIDNLMNICGTGADLANSIGYPNPSTFIGRMAMNRMAICDHDARYAYGVCVTYPGVFDFCGDAGSLLAYMQARGITDQGESTFLSNDGTVNPNITNVYLYQQQYQQRTPYQYQNQYQNVSSMEGNTTR